VVKDTPLSAVIDGQRESGMLVLNQAAEMAVAKARNNGMAIVGTNNTCTSTGALGFYADKVRRPPAAAHPCALASAPPACLPTAAPKGPAQLHRPLRPPTPTQLAREGMIGIVLAQSPEFVAPHGAKQAIFGTNPIAVGIPSAQGGDPMVMDMATAAYAWFGLLEAKTAGLPIPGDVAYDAKGELTTDPNEVGGCRCEDGCGAGRGRCSRWGHAKGRGQGGEGVASAGARAAVHVGAAGPGARVQAAAAAAAPAAAEQGAPSAASSCRRSSALTRCRPTPCRRCSTAAPSALSTAATRAATWR
jgi:hypothetical protein